MLWNTYEKEAIGNLEVEKWNFKNSIYGLKKKLYRANEKISEH